MSDWDVAESKQVKDPWAVVSIKEPKKEVTAKEQPKTWTQHIEDYFSKGGKTISEAAKSFFPAVGQGAIMQSSDNPLNESVMSPETDIQKTARKAGEYTGKALPFIAASSGVGAPVEAAVAGAGLPMLGEVAGGAATMATYKGAENLANKGLPNTGEKVGALAKDVAVGGATGAGMGATGFVLGKVADFFGSKFPAGVYNSIVRVTKGQALKDIKQGDYELIGGELASLPGFVGTKQGMIEKATKRVDSLQNEIDSTLKPYIDEEAKAGYSSISTDKVLEPLKELSDKYAKMPGYETQKKAVDALIKSTKKQYGDVMGIGTAQTLKKDIWHEIKDPAFAKSLENNPTFARSQILLGTGLRQQLAENVPALAPLNAEEGIYLGARNALQEEIARDRGNMSESLLVAPAYEAVATRAAQAAKKVFSPESAIRKTASAIGSPASGVGLSEMINNLRSKGKR